MCLYLIKGRTEDEGYNSNGDPAAIAFRASEDGSSEYMFVLEGGRQQAEWY